MTIDCTLDSLMIPALPTYDNEFGTKKQHGGLSTAECADDAMLPFRKMRPYEIVEDSETSEIQHNAVFVVKASDITLTLHDCSESFLGCEVRVINVSNGEITVKGGVSGIDGGTKGITVPAKREIRLIFLSDGWHSSYDDFCNITEKEIADSAVTTNKIKDRSVMNSKIGETLSIANGGTGATTANQAINSLATGLEEATGDGSDTMGFITTDATSIDLNANDKKLYKRSGLRVWNWIKGKVNEVLGLNENSLTTKTITSTGTITAKEFKGDVKGNADTATYATSAGSADTATYATSAGSAPASDVYAWAKQSTKPSYTKSEVGLGNVDNTADSNKSVKYATSAGNADAVAGYYVTTASSISSLHLVPVRECSLSDTSGYIKLGNGLLIHYFCVPYPRLDTKVNFNPPFKTPNYTVVLAGTSVNAAFFHDKTSSSVYVNIADFQDEINGIAIGLSA